MQTFIATLIIFGIAVGAMAIGVMVSGRRLKGSCGGPGADDCSCSIAEQKACGKLREGSAGS